MYLLNVSMSFFLLILFNIAFKRVAFSALESCHLVVMIIVQVARGCRGDIVVDGHERRHALSKVFPLIYLERYSETRRLLLLFVYRQEKLSDVNSFSILIINDQVPSSTDVRLVLYCITKFQFFAASSADSTTSARSCWTRRRLKRVCLCSVG